MAHRDFHFENRGYAVRTPAPLRKKSRLLRLLPCKRGRHASAALPTFCGQGQGLCYPFARAGPSQENCGFAKQNGSSLNSQAISPGSRRNAVQAISRAPQKVTLRLRCSLINALTTLRLATNFLRTRARAFPLVGKFCGAHPRLACLGVRLYASPPPAPSRKDSYDIINTLQYGRGR